MSIEVILRQEIYELWFYDIYVVFAFGLLGQVDLDVSDDILGDHPRIRRNEHCLDIDDVDLVVLIGLLLGQFLVAVMSLMLLVQDVLIELEADL